jgi:hypothetical protein
MKKHIDQLILKHEDQTYKRYILTCSVDDFKHLQKLMADEYKVSPKSKDGWRHVIEGDESFREGVVRFKGFELNVYCSPKIYAGYTISAMKALPLVYMDIFK